MTDGAIRAAARVAEEANAATNNTGARRLHTIVERILSEISFSAPERAAAARAAGQPSCTYVVDEALVLAATGEQVKRQDLSRSIL